MATPVLISRPPKPHRVFRTPAKRSGVGTGPARQADDTGVREGRLFSCFFCWEWRRISGLCQSKTSTSPCGNISPVVPSTRAQSLKAWAAQLVYLEWADDFQKTAPLLSTSACVDAAETLQVPPQVVPSRTMPCRVEVASSGILSSGVVVPRK